MSARSFLGVDLESFLRQSNQLLTAVESICRKTVPLGWGVLSVRSAARTESGRAVGRISGCHGVAFKNWSGVKAASLKRTSSTNAFAGSVGIPKNPRPIVQGVSSTIMGEVTE